MGTILGHSGLTKDADVKRDECDDGDDSRY